MLRIETPSKEPQPTYPPTHSHTHAPTCLQTRARTATLLTLAHLSHLSHLLPHQPASRATGTGTGTGKAKSISRPEAPPRRAPPASPASPASPTRPDRASDRLPDGPARQPRGGAAQNRPPDRQARRATRQQRTGPLVSSARLAAAVLTGRCVGRSIWWRAGEQTSPQPRASQECVRMAKQKRVCRVYLFAFALHLHKEVVHK
jgi:hypothetical protein